MIWAVMNFLLAGLSIGISILVSRKYFQSEFNHIENMWFSLAFFIFSIHFIFVGLSEWVFLIQTHLISFHMLQLYGYWILILMGFRLRQIHEELPYKLNKYIRVIVLMATIFTLFVYHLFTVYGFYNEVWVYYHGILTFLSLLAFILFPITGYYLFFRIGFGMIGFSHIINITTFSFPALEDSKNIAFILSFFGFISIGIALYFIFYSDSILEKRELKYERRQHSRRAEDKASF